MRASSSDEERFSPGRLVLYRKRYAWIVRRAEGDQYRVRFVGEDAEHVAHEGELQRPEPVARRCSYDPVTGGVRHTGNVERWADVLTANGGAERVRDLAGWAPYSALYRVGDRHYYTVLEADGRP